MWNLGHLDVVPALEEEWVYPPYSLTRKGDFMVGRGVQDNKGPLIAVLWALRYMKEKREGREKSKREGVRFKLVFGCNEEAGMEDVEYYLKNRKAPDFSFVADCSFPVCRGEKGICRFVFETGKLEGGLVELQAGSVVNSVPGKARAGVKGISGEILWLETEGVSGHCAFPEDTKNALEPLCRKLLKEVQEEGKEWGETYGFSVLSEKERRAIAFIGRLAQDGFGSGIGFEGEGEVSGRLTLNAGIVSLKEQRIRVEIDVRYPVMVEFEEVEGQLMKQAEDAGFRLIEEKNSPGFCLDENQWLVKLLMNAYDEVSEEHLTSYIMGGGTYARKIPGAVGFGPGRNTDISSLMLPPEHGGCHGADECQSLSALKQAVRIYVHSLEKIENDRSVRGYAQKEED